MRNEKPGTITGEDKDINHVKVVAEVVIHFEARLFDSDPRHIGHCNLHRSRFSLEAPVLTDNGYYNGVWGCRG